MVVAKVVFLQRDQPQILFGTDGMEKTDISGAEICDASAAAAARAGISASNTRWEEDV